MWRNRTQEWRETYPEAALVSSAKMRAKKKNLEFSITKYDIHIPEYCPILGIKLERASYGSKAGQPQSPSIDRIDSTKGYIPGNVWVISRQANMIKTNATLEQLIIVGNWAREALVVLT